MSSAPQPVLPDFSGGCISNVVPEVIKHLVGHPTADWLPDPVKAAKQVVLLVLDGLGWEQFQKKTDYLPTLAGFEGRAITTVAPSTTAVVLTSLVTGRPPAVTGVVGFRTLEKGQLFNTLKWKLEDGSDARSAVPPETYQVQPAFAANEIPAVVRSSFIGTGFTSAHMQGAKLVGYSALSSIPVEVWRLLNEGESFVYAYYDGIDTIAHDHGMGEHYDAELYTVDRLLRDLLAGMPLGSALLVTADHGHVVTNEHEMMLDDEIASRCYKFSGEARFRWLHAKGGISTEQLAAMCTERYGDIAWIRTREQVINEGWFGGPLSPTVAERLGDIALVPFEPVAFLVPGDRPEHSLVSRHGSLTSAEMLVPLVAHLKAE